MNKLAVAIALIGSVTVAQADTETTTVDTLVVITPNAPVVVTQNGAPALQPPGLPPAPAAAAANGAPQNEAWTNVSHINGVPIKVGERGDYLVKHKHTNIAVNPFGVFFGMYDISATHAVGQNVALTGAITAIDNEFFQVSATVPLYFRRVFSGPFLEGGLLYRASMRSDVEYAGCFDCGSSNDSWAGPQLMLGWHWTFDSGLNLAFAVGVAKRMNNQNEYGDNTEGNGYFRVGYAF